MSYNGPIVFRIALVWLTCFHAKLWIILTNIEFERPFAVSSAGFPPFLRKVDGGTLIIFHIGRYIFLPA